MDRSRFEDLFHGQLFPQHGRDEPPFAFLCRKLYDERERMPAGMRLLDIGAGESLYRSVFPQAEYVGCDLVSSSDKHDFSGLDVVGDASALPFRSGSFDYALNMVVLEHVADPWTAAREMGRILKPGGIGFALVPLVRPEHLAPYDFHRFTRFGISQMFERSGLGVVGIEPSNGALWTAMFYARQITQQRPIVRFGRHSVRAIVLNRFWWAVLAPLVWYARVADSKYPTDFPVYYWVSLTKR